MGAEDTAGESDGIDMLCLVISRHRMSYHISSTLSASFPFPISSPSASIVLWIQQGKELVANALGAIGVDVQRVRHGLLEAHARVVHDAVDPPKLLPDRLCCSLYGGVTGNVQWKELQTILALETWSTGCLCLVRNHRVSVGLEFDGQ